MVLNNTMHFITLTFCFILLYGLIKANQKRYTKSIEDIALEYEDDKNSMIAVTEKENSDLYEDFYDELDNRIRIEQSMNMIFFGPPSSFMRLDPETVLHILLYTKKHLIPITRALLAWDIITDGKTAAYLQGREFLAFGSLLNVIPEEDLYYVNFGDPSVLKYFANHNVNLHNRKYGVLVSAYRRYFGNNWHANSTYINELGYLLCGFPSTDLQKITPSTFREIGVDVLGRLKRCSVNQTKTLYNIATHPDAYGEPYKWSSHEVTRLNRLLTCIPEEDISSMHLEAITAISSAVMKNMHQNKLQYFTKQQILRMNPKTRRVYVLRMQLKNSLDMSHLTEHTSNTYLLKKSLSLLFVINLITILL
ncbi:uncharacterized protein LOC115444829 [Manduca sexta]|uniref:uncharacterized protein LOC115444829 n=1 Tax=Manduca sexta TaxID=7130 RepID=UPI001182FA17|nr:uncharacterized protein LOC115444829 [Manduca sexta]